MKSAAGHLTGNRNIARSLLFGCAALAMSGASGSASFADGLISKPVNQLEPFSKPVANREIPLTPAAASGDETGTLVQMGETALKAGRYLDAAVLFEKAADDPDFDPVQRQRAASLMQNAADALFQKGSSFPDNVALDTSIELQTRLLAFIDKTLNPGTLAAAQNGLGKALSLKGARFGDHPMMDKGIATIRTALTWRTFERSPMDWAQSQTDLAEALIASARISQTNEKFDEAIAICEEVKQKKSSHLLDAARTKANSVMANALWQYGQRQRDATLILSAKIGAEQALDATDKNVLPFEWATTLNYLANANREYAYWTSNGELLVLSIDQYNQSLEIRSRDKYPMQWAQTQLDLGNALGRLPDSESRPFGDDLAVEAYRRSLEVRSQRDTPLEWGMSQNNLAASLSSLLLRSPVPDAEDFGPVLDGYRKAIKATPLDSSPLDWALFQMNLASTLADLWDARQRPMPDNFQKEMDASMSAQASYPLALSFELNKLAAARSIERQISVENLEEAAAAYDNALKVYTKTERPWKWINAIHNKANVYMAIGRKQQNLKKFEAALAIFREEQTILQRQYDPRSWASLEISAGNALYKIGLGSWSSDRLREAETAYVNAIDALPKDQEQKRNETIEFLAYVRCNIGGIDGDKAKIQQAVDQYNLLKVASYAPRTTTREEMFARVEYLNQRISYCIGMIDSMTEARPAK